MQWHSWTIHHANMKTLPKSIEIYRHEPESKFRSVQCDVWICCPSSEDELLPSMPKARPCSGIEFSLWWVHWLCCNLQQDMNYVGFLHVLKDQTWVPVQPIQDALVVNIGDILEVQYFLFLSWFNPFLKAYEINKSKKYIILNNLEGLSIIISFTACFRNW